jgi:hypothetical protein
MDGLKKGYKVIKNFLTESEVELFTTYSVIKHRANFDNFDTVQNKHGDTMFYGDPATDTLMLIKQKLMEEKTGLKLLPTYTFWRMYTHLAELTKHKDRPACEISVTVQINSDGTPWPIYVGGKKILLKNGDGVIYKGTKVDHWREEFTGDWHSQVFMHYVDANGPHAAEYMDRRSLWGIEK